MLVRHQSLPISPAAPLAKELHALEPEERNLLDSFKARRPISNDAADPEEAQASFGDRLADRVAAVGGSWGFIIAFLVILVCWICSTQASSSASISPSIRVRSSSFNLMISLIAALPASVVMMSQNRQGTAIGAPQPRLRGQPTRRTGDHAAAREDRRAGRAAGGHGRVTPSDPFGAMAASDARDRRLQSRGSWCSDRAMRTRGGSARAE